MRPRAVARSLLWRTRMNPLPYDMVGLPMGQVAIVIDATPLLVGLVGLFALGAVLITGVALRSRRPRRRTVLRAAALLRLRPYEPSRFGYGES